MPNITLVPPVPDRLMEEVLPYEEYLVSLLEGDIGEAKARLVNLLSGLVPAPGREAVVTFKGGLPPGQIRQAYLEELFQDEEAAAAYLWALRPENDDPRIRQLEGEKDNVTDRMVDPLTKRRRQHKELLEMVWDFQKENNKALVDPGRSFLVKLFCNYGDEQYQDLFDTWADAEITRVRMRKLVRDLQQENPKIRSGFFKNTWIQGSRVNPKRWIIAAALVSQASQSSTPRDLFAVLGDVDPGTPRKMLKTMREAMAWRMRTNRFSKGEVAIFDDLVNGYRLCFQSLDYRHNAKHRNDLVLPFVGNLAVFKRERKRSGLPESSESRVVRPANENEVKDLKAAFNGWVAPYRNAVGKGENHLVLADFAYRYQGDRRRFMGWRLINDLLRLLLESPTNKYK